MKWYGLQKKKKTVLNENTSSGTDKVSLSHHDILSLENEKATLLICIGLFLHLFPICDYMLVKRNHSQHDMTWE